MRKLPLLLALLLLTLLAATVPAQAASLVQPAPFPALLEAEDEEAEAVGSEADEPEDEEELCEPDEEEFCEEEAEEPRGKGKGKDDGCLLKSARAAVTVNPGKRRLRLSVHYKTSKPASVSVEAVLRGVQGAVNLGTDHARFRRSGVYRDTFQLAEKQTKKALAAREVSVDLQVVNASCGLHLVEAVRRTH